MALMKVVIPLTKFKPMQARTAQMNSSPTGEILRFFSMKCAQKRKANMNIEVYTKRILPSFGVRMLPVMF